MTDEEKNKELSERAKEIFPSPEIASAFIQTVVNKRPLGWSRKSNAPYYAEKYAVQIKKDIDSVIATGKPIIYRYSIWCGSEQELMTRNTLYNRINQSLRFLCDKMDPDDKYKNWYTSVRLHKNYKNIGLAIIPILGLDSNPLSAEQMEVDTHMPEWKIRLEDWLEGEGNEPFIQEGLVLTKEEMIALKEQFDPLVNVKYSITARCVKVIKMNV